MQLISVADRLDFYPRPPGGGRPPRKKALCPATDFDPRPPGGGRPAFRPRRPCDTRISIHALRVEGDIPIDGLAESVNISIHALRVEGDDCQLGAYAGGERFLSTPSGWRATQSIYGEIQQHFYFYPRPPGGGRLKSYIKYCYAKLFLSTPSGWRATLISTAIAFSRQFLSTPSGWRATLLAFENGVILDISIHALRVEGDPRRSCYAGGADGFLSTPSGWRATKSFFKIREKFLISIHALRVEGDRDRTNLIVPHVQISIHALRVEGDSKNGQSFRLFLRKREKNLPL